MYIIKCGKCGKKYGYELIGTVYPGGKEKETAYCPYCEAEGPSEMTSQFISVCALDENEKPLKEEDDWKKISEEISQLRNE